MEHRADAADFLNRFVGDVNDSLHDKTSLANRTDGPIKQKTTQLSVLAEAHATAIRVPSGIGQIGARMTHQKRNINGRLRL